VGESEPFRVLVVDDSRFQCAAFRLLLESRFGDQVKVETCEDPRRAVELLGTGVDLVLLDWEMPGLDGAAVLTQACRQGLDPRRVIISSSRSADELHRKFDASGCLAVIEKGEAEQQKALLMILDALVRRHTRR
jgi:CheY-like chemotaxis protein